MAASEWAAGRTVGGLIRRARELMGRLDLAGKISAAGGAVCVWFDDDSRARVAPDGAWSEDPTSDATRFLEAYQREWHPDDNVRGPAI